MELVVKRPLGLFAPAQWFHARDTNALLGQQVRHLGGQRRADRDAEGLDRGGHAGAPVSLHPQEPLLHHLQLAVVLGDAVLLARVDLVQLSIVRARSDGVMSRGITAQAKKKKAEEGGVNEEEKVEPVKKKRIRKRTLLS